MNNLSSNKSSFSSICIEYCKGKCCDPWWGIIAYQIRKDGGLNRHGNFLSDLKVEILKGVRDRELRIVERYVTSERPPRHLFKSPERYSIITENISVNGRTILINLRAMYAFRCLFLSSDNVCTIHPSILGGNDIRPEHCGYLGSLDAKPNEKGYCRIIQAASGIISPPLTGGGQGEGEQRGSPDALSKINAAIDMEKSVSEKFYREGYTSAELAVDALIDKIKVYLERNAPALLSNTVNESAKSPGRNDPCFCGSGKKFKKCHGV